MKKLLVAIIFILSLFLCHAQPFIYEINLSATLINRYEGFEKGSQVKISGVIHEALVEPYNQNRIKDLYYIRLNEQLSLVTRGLVDKLNFECKTVQDIWNSEIIKKVLVSLQNKGIQKELRLEMEQDALEYIERLNSNGLRYNEPYLENYIYGLIAKIAPVDFIDGRPENVNLIILDDASLNVGMYPNGTLMITTGILSCLHSEDELVAVLSHEIAHFVLDHQIQNVNKAVSRKKRAEFWTAFATGVTAVAEGAIAANNQNYVPGMATIGMAILSSSIASQMIDRLGMKYNHEQEGEADKLAKRILSILQYDTNALSTVLAHIREVMETERSDGMYFASFTHPALSDRIMYLGNSQMPPDPNFEKEISFAVTSTARKKYGNGRFRQAIDLVSQNIVNEVAISEDFILKAYCLFALYNNYQSNHEAMSLINSAKEINPSDINIYKAEILAYLRLGERETALRLLQEYESKLISLFRKDYSAHFIESELSWSKNMQIKLKGM